ncbi:glycosyltransferase family A protein [Sphingomonas sp.]|uniref:glycosyltransferase family 2 protein n=1 Tax=Sphingomonas sp. TaxID=28214 RepID=UPI0025E86639|nr:glycosyltransferase family A protein [Sphingomonas sp.]
MNTVAEVPPLVSIVIPAYAVRGFLADAVKSVLAQTMTDFEVIVVDDCSPDDVATELAHAGPDPRIRLVRHAENGGATAARNTGIANARGRFIAFLDHDDSWLPTKLERQLAGMMARPDPDKVFCVTGTIVNLADGRHVLRPVRGKRPDERMDEFIFVQGGFCQTSSFLVGAGLARRAAWRDLPTGEDHLFAIDLCALGAEYLLIDAPLTIYNNDLRSGRLSNDKTLATGARFMAAVGGVLSAKALQAYEIRYLGPAILRRNPVDGLVRIVRAVAAGAMSPRFAGSLLVRTMLPDSTYQRARAALLGQRKSAQN